MEIPDQWRFIARKTSINDATASHDETGFISKSLSPHRMSSGASHRLGVVAPATEYMLQITSKKIAWFRSLTLAKKIVWDVKVFSKKSLDQPQISAKSLMFHGSQCLSSPIWLHSTYFSHVLFTKKSLNILGSENFGHFT
jgi:hypothetical protein